MIYTKTHITSSSVIDSSARLSLIGLFDVVENAITECMGQLHLDGITVKRDFNAFWVFTKNKIVLRSRPSWGERFVVESFVSALSAAKMVVDTALKLEDGTLFAYSSCEMCLLDIATGRIRRTSSVMAGPEPEVHPPLMEVAFDKFDGAELPQVGTVTVSATNIDYSRHCNNVEYLRFVLNTYTARRLAELPVQYVQVNYVAQSYEGDVLSVHKQSTPSCDTFAIQRAGSDGEVVIRCIVRLADCCGS